MKNIFLFLFLFLATSFTNAQCAMCKAVIESEENIATAEGVNDGITYLMVFPYLLIAILAFFIIRHRKKQENL